MKNAEIMTNGVPKMLKHEVTGLHFGTKLGAKMAPEALLPQGGRPGSERLLGGPLGASWASPAPGGSRGASGRSFLVFFWRPAPGP